MAFRKITSSSSPTPAVLGGHGGVPQPAERHDTPTLHQPVCPQHPDTLRVKNLESGLHPIPGLRLPQTAQDSQQ